MPVAERHPRARLVGETAHADLTRVDGIAGELPIWDRRNRPGKVFDLELPLDQAADGYRAMDQRDALKVLLRP
jgi:hypothetical protein